MRYLATVTLLFTILSLVIASPSQHLPRRRHHSRHREFTKLVGRQDANHTLTRREDCTYGAWRCQGSDLQRMYCPASMALELIWCYRMLRRYVEHHAYMHVRYDLFCRPYEDGMYLDVASG